MQPSTPPDSPGFVDSVRALSDGFIASLQHRLELFSVELQEEKFRLIQAFIWISAIAFTAMMAVMFASFTLVYFFWESARLAVLGGLTVIYAGTLAALVIAFRRHLARQAKPFAATLDEIGKDRTCIRPGN
ncbi:phage holin family protein [Geminisphaera colitermitum]|uniref:phage holin family protein n=1 Tax=Geminisphaera colitermitum TaxID=1148786 RepID=UPI000158CA5E|nr:phage holin family protein [Geminisphaera colitermitum]